MKDDFKTNWINDMAYMVKMKYPKLSRTEIDKKLSKIYDDNIKDEEVELADTYKNITYMSSKLQLISFLDKTKPLLAGNGVLFDPKGRNPAVNLLHKFKKRRTNYKNMMKQYPPESFLFYMYNLYQMNEKVKMNAWYGICGALTSLFFNLECAAGITGKGRELTSTATVAFDSFLGTHLIFLSMNECLIYIKNICKEEDKIEDDFIPQIDRIYIRNLLKSFFDDESKCDVTLLDSILSNLSQSKLKKIFYKNNIYAFCKLDKIKSIVYTAVTMIEHYNNPAEDKTPDELKKVLDELWYYLEEFVFYKGEYMDKLYKVLHKPRKAVLVIDTDSNMLHIDPWFEFIKSDIVTKEELESFNMEHFSHTCVYVMCYELSKMIRATLFNYLSKCNVPEKIIPILDMKNEYLFSSMLITDVKKNYATLVDYKEGKPMFGIPDFKGLPITKSSANRIASERFKEILVNDILSNIDNISLIDILMKLYSFQNEIKQSLLNGENKFLKPVNVKDPRAYDDPLKVSGLRAADIWNDIYQDNQIILPDSFFLIKLKTHKKSDLYLIEDDEMRKKIEDMIFNNPEDRIRSKGFYVFAVPRDTLIPDWVKPCIDVDLMVEDIMRTFMGVIRAIGISSVFTSAQNNQISSFVTL